MLFKANICYNSLEDTDCVKAVSEEFPIKFSNILNLNGYQSLMIDIYKYNRQKNVASPCVEKDPVRCLFHLAQQTKNKKVPFANFYFSFNKSLLEIVSLNNIFYIFNF